MLGIAIPAHDEGLSIAACVRAALDAATHARLNGEACVVMVVADACSDDTALIRAIHHRLEAGSATGRVDV